MTIKTPLSAPAPSQANVSSTPSSAAGPEPIDDAGSVQAPVSQAPMSQGLHHLGLTVRDCHQVGRFFVEHLGFNKVGEKPDYPAVFVSDGSVMLTLWQAQTESPSSFDRKNNLGLHHFALRLAPGRSLAQVCDALQKSPQVQIEFPPEPLGTSPAQHMMCVVCDSFRMELIALPT